MLQELVFHPQISGNYFCGTEKGIVLLCCTGPMLAKHSMKIGNTLSSNITSMS